MTTETTRRRGVPDPTAYTLRHTEVRDARRISPAVVRITLGGPDLDSLPTAAPDGYLKLFFPLSRGEVPPLPEVPAGGDDTAIGRWYSSYLALPDEVRPPMRTYTLRRRRDHPDGVEIDVDMVLHGDGPGSGWARDAQAGDRVAFTGPYGLYAPRPEHDAVLLVGDETAVPAIGAIVESLAPGTRADVIAEVSSAAEVRTWQSAGDVEVTWVHGGLGVLEVLARHELPGRHPYVWLAGEAGRVRELRRHLTRERDVDRRDVQFCGYWRRGKSEDDLAREATGSGEADEAVEAAGRGEAPEA